MCEETYALLPMCMRAIGWCRGQFRGCETGNRLVFSVAGITQEN